jgi:hypothetical protein
MHQAMLDRYVQELARRERELSLPRSIQSIDPFIDRSPCPLHVLPHSSNARPIRGLIGRKTAIHWVNPKCEKTVESRIKRLRVQNSLAEKVPIEGFEMTNVENDAMSLANGTLVQRIGANDLEQRIGYTPGVVKTVEQRTVNGKIPGSRYHALPPFDSTLDALQGSFGSRSERKKHVQICSVPA